MSNKLIMATNNASTDEEGALNVPAASEDVKINLNITDVTDEEWMQYFNADMLESYSPSSPFFIHSLLKDLDKHQQILDGRGDNVDYPLVNNISVIPHAFEELLLDANIKGMTYDQGYNVDESANNSNNVNFRRLTKFGYANGASRAPLSAPCVDANHKTFAMQHFAAQTTDVASPLDTQHAARVDGQGLNPQGLLFDDVSP
ncbi:hypothetical protein QFC20_007240 [Naganishia adeliensis]|uniref:Uncharacterized protein n=1 Tax=Naganishia adeliensis TaxID=92952 RepID=A0ACC2V2X1_9TREE|nr:hypothetical protein QFC20_007240 [Naganishia adeliensis]